MDLCACCCNTGKERLPCNMQATPLLLLRLTYNIGPPSVHLRQICGSGTASQPWILFQGLQKLQYVDGLINTILCEFTRLTVNLLFFLSFAKEENKRSIGCWEWRRRANGQSELSCMLLKMSYSEYIISDCWWTFFTSHEYILNSKLCWNLLGAKPWK